MLFDHRAHIHPIFVDVIDHFRDLEPTFILHHLSIYINSSIAQEAVRADVMD